MEERINSLSKLGVVLKSVGKMESWKGFDLGLTEEEFEKLKGIVRTVNVFNGWFTSREVEHSFQAWGELLDRENLMNWINRYSTDSASNKTVGIIMAGNIPMVGFHDLLCTYILGQKAKVKLSSDDDKLIPAVLDVLRLFDPALDEKIELIQGKLEGIDAVIATGSNNTSRYFEQYFGKYPNIIRKSRTSIAVLDGNESEEELKGLSEDIFRYYGLGCRNVTKVYVPKGYNLDNIFGGLYDHRFVTDNNKYANNYDYHKAVFLMEKYDVIENGFILLRREESFYSPVGTLNYEEYEDLDEVKKLLNDRSEEIQCVVSKTDISFGQAQKPQLWDYADNVDTIEFLLGL